MLTLLLWASQLKLPAPSPMRISTRPAVDARCEVRGQMYRLLPLGLFATLATVLVVARGGIDTAVRADPTPVTTSTHAGTTHVAAPLLWRAGIVACLTA